MLHVYHAFPTQSFLGELQDPATLPPNALRCLFYSRTLMFSYAIRTVVRGMRQILKPGGVAFAALAVISRILRFNMNRSGHPWRFIGHSAKRVFTEVFGENTVEVRTCGKSLAPMAFVQRVECDEFSAAERDWASRDNEVIIGIRSVKSTHPMEAV